MRQMASRPDHAGPIFSRPVVCAVTSTASLGSATDLDELWNCIEIGRDEGVVAARNASFTECRPPGSMELGRGFGRQITALVAVPGRSAAKANVKIFPSGMMQATGVKSKSESRAVFSAVARACGRGEEVVDVRVRMVNAHMRHSPAVGRRRLVQMILDTSPGLRASFDPSLASVAKVFFCFDTADPASLSTHSGACACPIHCAFAPPRQRRCFRCSALVHRTGTIKLTGACTEQHVERAAQILEDLVRRC